MENLTQDQLFLIGVLFLVGFGIWWKKRPDDAGRLPDAAVNLASVKKMIAEFNPERDDKYKYGYTEKSIENQLEKFFKQRIRHVTTQYGIEGLNASKIDLHLGSRERGVGVEIKLAKAVFKSNPQNTMVGQIGHYVDSKYNNNNLLLLIFCEEEHRSDEAAKKQIENRLENSGPL